MSEYCYTVTVCGFRRKREIWFVFLFCRFCPWVLRVMFGIVGGKMVNEQLATCSVSE